MYLFRCVLEDLLVLPSYDYQVEVVGVVPCAGGIPLVSEVANPDHQGPATIRESITLVCNI